MKLNDTKHPEDFYLIPWSVGYECRTKEPEGFSIHVKPVVPGSVMITREQFNKAYEKSEPIFKETIRPFKERLELELFGE